MFIFAGIYSLPTTCPDTDVKNNARLSVVQKITYLALPAAVGLKNLLVSYFFNGIVAICNFLGGEVLPN
jgi:hypothetical protein